MKSFSQELKNEIVAEIIRHREQDQIIQGVYGDGEGSEWKGCAVGCAIHSLNLKKGKDYITNDHYVYEKEFGIPLVLAKLEDGIFEGLSVEESKTWPEDFMSAVPADTDLSMVWPRLAIWILTNETYGVINRCEGEHNGIIQRISDLYAALVAGETVNSEDWMDARFAAYAADAAYAAAYAAYAAAYAREDHYKLMADKLTEILKGEK